MSLGHELPIFLAINTILCFNKAQFWYIDFSVEVGRPTFSLDDESVELDLKTRTGM